jgi:hypothetical protein
MPQTRASAAPTRATQAGSLGCPRCGGGARYGVSVSTNARSGGTSAAPSLTVSPVSKATGPAYENITPRSRYRRVHLGPPVQQCITVWGPTPDSSINSMTSAKASRQWTMIGLPSSTASLICLRKDRIWSARGDRLR